ncbi:hypothetical protein R6Q57_010842 [Mikania cordata]
MDRMTFGRMNKLSPYGVLGPNGGARTTVQPYVAFGRMRSSTNGSWPNESLNRKEVARMKMAERSNSLRMSLIRPNGFYQQDQQAYQQFDQQAFQQQSPFHDYRHHTQDDSDSTNHNKSVQVESEEEEPIRPTGKKARGKKASAKRWTDEEEVALAKSWLTISENLDVTDHFHQLMKDNSRTLDQIYSKWNELNSAMKK